MEAQVLKSSMLSIQVCVPKQWEDSKVLEFAEKENPCGTMNGWQIRREGDEALIGMPERNQCDEQTDFVHIMLDA